MSFVFYKREKLSWGRRRITFLGIKFNYVTRMRKNFNYLIQSLDLITSLSDITLLKKAKGPLRDHQLKLLGFAKKINSQLELQNIYPFMIAGSLIGLLRHRGFIPWDDDIDFSVNREEFERLLSYVSENYILIDNNKINPNLRKDYFKILDSKLRDNPNQVIAVNYFTHLKLLTGSSLADSVAFDFFPMEYINEFVTIDKYKEESLKIHPAVRDCKSLEQAHSVLKKLSKKSELFSDTPTAKMYYGFDNLDATKRSHKHFFETEWIYPLKKAEFEGVEFFVPNQPDVFIRNMIGGDYMSYPPDVGYSAHIQEIRKNLNL